MKPTCTLDVRMQMVRWGKKRLLGERKDYEENCFFLYLITTQRMKIACKDMGYTAR